LTAHQLVYSRPISRHIRELDLSPDFCALPLFEIALEPRQSLRKHLLGDRRSELRWCRQSFCQPTARSVARQLI
jgi:hypothetical protein